MKSVLAVVIALVIGLAGGFAGGCYYVKHQPDPIPTIIDPEIVDEEIVEISELATCQDTYTSNVPYTGENIKLWKTNIKIPLTGKRMVVEYKATIKLGLNLTNDNHNVKVDGQKITVEIPHSEILSHEIIEDSWVLKDKKNGLFNPLTPEDDSELRKLAKKNATEKVVTKELYQEADDNAQSQILKFLKTAYPDAEIVVNFK